jgi:hypothetical protein
LLPSKSRFNLSQQNSPNKAFCDLMNVAAGSNLLDSCSRFVFCTPGNMCLIGRQLLRVRMQRCLWGFMFSYEFVYFLQQTTSFLFGFDLYKYLQMHFRFPHFTNPWFDVLLDPMSAAKSYALLNIVSLSLFAIKNRTYLKRALIFADPGSSVLDQPLKRSVILKSVIGSNPQAVHNPQSNP